MITEQVGAGITTGTDVRVDGVRVGTVTAITTDAPGRQRLDFTVARSELFDLTDAMSVDYAPSNLFGISALQLHSAPAGRPLTDGSVIDLTGRASERVRDVTLSSLLRSTGVLTDEVLTPTLTELLDMAARDLRGFTPLLQAIAATARAVTDTRRLPSSVLLEQFGSALAGSAPMITGGMGVLYSIYTNDYFADPEHITRYSRIWSDIQDQLLPAVTRTLRASRQYFADSLPVITLALDRISASVADPERAHDQLAELLDRLRAAFRDTPNGPTLATHVELDTVPGLAGPLAALLDRTHPEAGR
nr:MlaD family protein [Nocardia bovistercoris]